MANIHGGQAKIRTLQPFTTIFHAHFIDDGYSATIWELPQATYATHAFLKKGDRDATRSNLSESGSYLPFPASRRGVDPVERPVAAGQDDCSF
ncbi:MAG: hypothetical protein H7834_10275 [Magnetococcus sp. YQC-9]